MSTFIQAAKSFKYAEGNDIYVGPVIVSEESIFLTCKKVFSADKALKRKAGIIGNALSKLIEKEADPFEYAVPIPDEVLNDNNWPVDKEITTAIIIQKTDADKIKYPFWGSLCVTVNNVNFNIMADFFSRKKILNIFRENNWNIK
jgi:hypothetical protein